MIRQTQFTHLYDGSGGLQKVQKSLLPRFTASYRQESYQSDPGLSWSWHHPQGEAVQPAGWQAGANTQGGANPVLPGFHTKWTLKRKRENTRQTVGALPRHPWPYGNLPRWVLTARKHYPNIPRSSRTDLAEEFNIHFTLIFTSVILPILPPRLCGKHLFQKRTQCMPFYTPAIHC